MRTDSSKEIISLMNKLKEDYSPENQFALLTALFKTTVYVPTSEVKVSGAIKPIPVAISTNDGKLFQPAFLDESDVDEKAKETYVTTIEFEELASIVVKQNEMYRKTDKDFKLIEGIVINPSLQATVISTKVIELYLSTLAPEKMPEDQYTLFARCRFEQWILPTAFFNKGEEFVRLILQGKTDFLNQMFEQSYEGTYKYPYSAEDFKIAAMHPTENTLLAKIVLPAKNHTYGTAECAFLTLKKDIDEKHFFVIIKEPNKEAVPYRTLIEIKADRKANKIGIAPDEGSEVNWIIDYIK